MGTPIDTVIPGATREKDVPIQVTLETFYKDEDAFAQMEKRSSRNKGFTSKSEVKYIFYTIRVKNLSSSPVTIPLNDSLSDPNRNLMNRTGIVYDLNSVAVDLPPGEEAILESWQSSTSINNSYLVWGADFPRSLEPVWFKVLKFDQPTPQEGKDQGEKK